MFDGAPPESVDAWLRSLLATTSEHAVILVTPEGVITAWLGASERHFGHTAEQAVGMPFSKLFTPEDLERGLDRQECARAMSGGRSEDDCWHIRRDGSRFWGSGVLELVHEGEDGPAMLVKVVRDRTDVRSHVEALQNRLREANRQNAEHLRFLAAVAHELRNQLAPMRNAITLFDMSPREGGEKKALSIMSTKVDVMNRLLTDLADASRDCVARPQLELAEVHVQRALDAAALFLAEPIAQRHQTLIVTAPDAPILIEADPHRVDQMLSNLLSNASKFTPDSGTIRLSATVEADTAAIRVEDTGCGISSEVLPKIFELFTREARQGAPEGLGVGLAVVKQLAELHGGFVEGRSPGPGKGSIFTLRLPLCQINPAGDEPSESLASPRS